MSGSLYLGAVHFDGDPGELLPAYHRLLEGFGIDTLDVHLCVSPGRRADGVRRLPHQGGLRGVHHERRVPHRGRCGGAARAAHRGSGRCPGRPSASGGQAVTGELALLDATAQADLVHTGQVTAAELVDGGHRARSRR